MMHAFEFSHVTKRYKEARALDDVSLAVPARSIVGLVGRNGSGKTTLLRHVTGLVLPTSGECITLGTSAAKLGRRELSRIGAVNQHDTLLEWMRVEQLISYVSSFYDTWDRDLERRLMAELEVDPKPRVGTLSPGNLQRLALLLATCHHPSLLLLDEPLSDLDPIARQSVLAMLLDRFSSDAMTIVISSHMLRDIEPVVNRIVCLREGRVVADDDLDALKERYAEWIVTSRAGRLPAAFREEYILTATGTPQQARLVVRDPERHAAAFRASYDAEIDAHTMSLERIFTVLAGGSVLAARGAAEAVVGAGSER